MSTYDYTLWSLMEEAAVRDRGGDEEDSLAGVVRSFLARRGLADTLRAFDKERAELDGNVEKEESLHSKEKRPNITAAPTALMTTSSTNTATNDAAFSVERRKEAQLLCLAEKYAEAAQLMPANSITKIILLCYEAQRMSNSLEATKFLTIMVAPLVLLCTDVRVAHMVYASAFKSIVEVPRQPPRISPETVARTANNVLCNDGSRSGLGILFDWAYSQRKLSA